MMNLLIECLKNNAKISDWTIMEEQVETYESFYVLQRLETTRRTSTKNDVVTLFQRFVEKENTYLGRVTFTVSHDLSKSELEEKIEQALFSSQFAKNVEYDLTTDKDFTKQEEPSLSKNPYEMLSTCAQYFFDESSKERHFNSLELFYFEKTNHFMSSKGLDKTKHTCSFEIEAIPSYDGEDGHKVELYRYYRYKTFDDKKIQEDARLALEDVTSRYLAKKLTDLKTVDVLLRSDDIAQLAEQLIEDFSFRQVFNKANTKKIGDDLIAGVEKDKLTISLAPYSKADSFDAEGINLEPCTIVENGKVVAYFGGNQFASYLKMAPTGQLPKVILTPGKTEEKEMRKTPYLEILDLSGIQIDVLAHYIGGEVRLANYFDGTKLHPVSDFSFSGNLDEVLKNVVLSKETKDTVTYSVPKIIKLPKMNLI